MEQKYNGVGVMYFIMAPNSADYHKVLYTVDTYLPKRRGGDVKECEYDDEHMEKRWIYAQKILDKDGSKSVYDGLLKHMLEGIMFAPIREERVSVYKQETMDLQLIQLMKKFKLEEYQFHNVGKLSIKASINYVRAVSVLLHINHLIFLQCKDQNVERETLTYLREITEKTAITICYFCSHLCNSMKLSDEIVVADERGVLQMDTLATIYKCPKTLYIAQMVGKSNLFPCEVILPKQKITRVRVGSNMELLVSCPKTFQGDAILAVRPEHIYFAQDGLKGIILETNVEGDMTRYVIRLDNNQIVEVMERRKETSKQKDINSLVHILFRTDQVYIFDSKQEQRILNV